MNHAKSLRVIGQSLEVAKLRVFELQTDGSNYILSSDSLSRTGVGFYAMRLVVMIFSTGVLPNQQLAE
jgi:hypothetical protein